MEPIIATLAEAMSKLFLFLKRDCSSKHSAIVGKTEKSVLGTSPAIKSRIPYNIETVSSILQNEVIALRNTDTFGAVRNYERFVKSDISAVLNKRLKP